MAHLDVIPDAEQGCRVEEAGEEGEADAGPGHEVRPADQEGGRLSQHCQRFILVSFDIN